MDKYTYNIKAEKIMGLVEGGEYDAAAKLADEIDWKQVHSLRMLMTVADVYERTQRYGDAIKILLQAYEDAPMGKRILYKLTEVALESGNIADAEQFYRMFIEEAPEENSRYILRYKLAVAKDEPLERKIAILESYRGREFDEEWAYELAMLYKKAGMKEKCMALCDDVILWFGVGPFVEKCQDLKESYSPLTQEQLERKLNRAKYRERLKSMNDMADISGTASQTYMVDGGFVHAMGDGADDISAIVSDNEDGEPSKDTMDDMAEAAKVTAGDSFSDLSGSQEAVKDAQSIFESEVKPASSKTVPISPISLPDVELPGEKAARIRAEKLARRQEEEGLEFAADDVAAGIGREPEIELSDAAKEARDARMADERNMSASATSIMDSVRKKYASAGGGAPMGDLAQDQMTGEDASASTDSAGRAGEEQSLAADDVEIPHQEAFGALAKAAASGAFEAPPADMTQKPIRRSAHKLIFIPTYTSENGIKIAIRELKREYDAVGGQPASPVKIYGEKLNVKGLVPSLRKLVGKDVIIERAGALDDRTIREITDIRLTYDRDKIFILIDMPYVIPHVQKKFEDVEAGLCREQAPDIETYMRGQGVMPGAASADVSPKAEQAGPVITPVVSRKAAASQVAGTAPESAVTGDAPEPVVASETSVPAANISDAAGSAPSSGTAKTEAPVDGVMPGGDAASVSAAEVPVAAEPASKSDADGSAVSSDTIIVKNLSELEGAFGRKDADESAALDGSTIKITTAARGGRVTTIPVANEAERYDDGLEDMEEREDFPEEETVSVTGQDKDAGVPGQEGIQQEADNDNAQAADVQETAQEEKSTVAGQESSAAGTDVPQEDVNEAADHESAISETEGVISQGQDGPEAESTMPQAGVIPEAESAMPQAGVIPEAESAMPQAGVIPETESAMPQKSAIPEAEQVAPQEPVSKNNKYTTAPQMLQDDEEDEYDSGTVLKEDAFVEYIKEYAKRIDCIIEPSAMDAILGEVAEMKEDGTPLTVGEAEMMIEDAADTAETKSTAFRAKYAKDGCLILRKKHFQFR